MKVLKKLFDTTTKRVIAIVVLVVLVTWLILFFVRREVAFYLVKPILLTFLVVAVSWLLIHFGLKAWRKRKRAAFDEGVAAKEGIEDRRREWATWTTELEKQGIDRYELPFYLLVGEPQSGKSVLLHNSDLHFPFGQNRLSGVGGTRGCDWWFTEEAVILDLAGRLFTHEGGTADRLEFEAFLQLLNEFRPLCPANGVILVIPCDSLLKDTEEQCAAKATKIQNALLTLTTKLQAQLPVYLVLTKGDQIFGFAESVHRLDVERRHQMFGWSRPADKIDAPFDVAEVVHGFEELVRRGRLLRAHMSAGARLPEALPEVDRMYAFPHELGGMQPNLEVYLKRIFTASSITDRVFFRGVYLTSGLQSGVPIAKVCKELFGQAGEADMRDLQALFSKPRAYFIKDLIRTRVFGERGLVRPTQGRVQQTRRTSLFGYGLSALVAVGSLIWAAVYLLSGVTDERQAIRDEALAGAEGVMAEKEPSLAELLFRLQQVRDAAELDSEVLEQTLGSDESSKSFQRLYCELFDARLVPVVGSSGLAAIEGKLSGGELASFDDLIQTCEGLSVYMQGVDFSEEESRETVLACLGDPVSGGASPGGKPLKLSDAFELRLDYGERGSGLRWDESGVKRIVPLAELAVQALERSLEPGARTAPREAVGYMIAWYHAETAHEALDGVGLDKAIETSRAFAGAMRTLKEIEDNDLDSSKTIHFKDVGIAARALRVQRDGLVAFLEKHASKVPSTKWSRMEGWMGWSSRKMNEKGERGRNLADFNVIFGTDDLTQTIYQETDAQWATVTTTIKIPDKADPFVELNAPERLLELCNQSLPLRLTDGGLTDLGQNIARLSQRDLEKDGPNSLVFKVFLAQCRQAAGLFARQIDTADKATSGVQASAGRGELCQPLVVELSELHRALEKLIEERKLEGAARDEMLAWEAAIEGILHEHLRACTPGDWVPPIPVGGTFAPEGWSMLVALKEASELDPAQPGIRVSFEARKLLRGVFRSLASNLLERWDARSEDDIDETAKTVEELQLLSEEVDTHLAKSKALLSEGGELSDWSGGIDTILNTRLEKILASAEERWTPDPGEGSFRTALLAWRRDLDEIPSKIRDSDEVGLQRIEPILRDLGNEGSIASWLDLPQTAEAVARLRDFQVPTSSDQVKRHKEYNPLSTTLDDLLDKDEDGESFGQDLAARLRDLSAATKPVEGEKTNAGVGLVRRIRASLQLKMAEEVRNRYLAELKDQFDRKAEYKTLLELIYWDPTRGPATFDDNQIVEALSELLDKDKYLSRAGKKYKLDEIGKLVFAPSASPDQDPWEAFHSFLLSLQTFLRSDKARIREAKFNFQIEPVVERSDSLWVLANMSPGEGRSQFYALDTASSENNDPLRTKHLLSTMGKVEVRNWSLKSQVADRRMLLIWSDKTDNRSAQEDGRAFVHEVPTSLAPLLLAWTGNPIDLDNPRRFEVEFVPSGQSRTAPMVLEFENPIPLRPPEPVP